MRAPRNKNVFGPMRILRFQIATGTGRECSGGTYKMRTTAPHYGMCKMFGRKLKNHFWLTVADARCTIQRL
jgi:hypothetical protein